jgi:hypothetical protein
MALLHWPEKTRAGDRLFEKGEQRIIAAPLPMGSQDIAPKT